MTATATLIGLNPQQEKAVTTTDKHVLLLAGAGSGKTRCLTHRINHLVQQGLAKPKNIMAVTFTNKAANEMRSRLKTMMGDGTKDVWLGTFHSICVRILKMFGTEIGLPKNFTIYDEDDASKLMKEVLKDQGVLNVRTVRDVLGTISRWKTELRSPVDVLDARQSMPREFDEICADAYDLYQKRLVRANAVDFDDIMLLGIKVLNHSAKAREWAHKKFSFILVDEYQDSNPVQYQLISRLMGENTNLFVVGDPDQGIYSWRGADINIILNFKRDYPNAEVIYLEENYRSHRVIVEAAEAVIANNLQRMPKKCFTSKAKGPMIELYKAYNEMEEADWIAATIEHLTRYEGVEYRQVAILNRTNFQARAVELGLIDHGIPYKMITGINFFDRKEIKDTMAFVNLAVNPFDTVNFKRAFCLFPKCGEVNASKIVKYASDKNVSLVSALLSSNNKHVVNLIPVFDDIDQARFRLTPSDFLEYIWNRIDYEAMLPKDNTLKQRLNNLALLLEVADGYSTIEEFMDSTALASANDEDGGDVVKVMTIHAAKGLEFDVVFLAGMEEGQFPHKNNLYDPTLLEEERRLAYVGITRAIDRLFVSWARNRQRFGILNNFNSVSRFVEEIPRVLIDADDGQFI